MDRSLETLWVYRGLLVCEREEPEVEGTMSDYARVTMWAMDFIRAARERPLWAKIALRFVLGKYAYSELIGMMDAIQRDTGCVYFSYDLEGGEWHKNPMPRWWWIEREPHPLKE